MSITVWNFWFVTSNMWFLCVFVCGTHMCYKCEQEFITWEAALCCSLFSVSLSQWFIPRPKITLIESKKIEQQLHQILLRRIALWFWTYLYYQNSCWAVGDTVDLFFSVFKITNQVMSGNLRKQTKNWPDREDPQLNHTKNELRAESLWKLRYKTAIHKGGRTIIS